MFAWSYYNLFRMANRIHIHSNKFVHITNMFSIDAPEEELSKTPTGEAYYDEGNVAYLYIDFHALACTFPSLMPELNGLQSAYQNYDFLHIDIRYVQSTNDDVSTDVAMDQVSGLAMTYINQNKLTSLLLTMRPILNDAVIHRTTREILSVKQMLDNSGEWSSVINSAFSDNE